MTSTTAWNLTIFDDVLPEVYLGAAYGVFRELVISSGLFYVSVDSLKADSAASALSAYLPHAVAAFVSEHLMRVATICPPDLMNRGDGFEFWVGVTAAGGTTVRLHVDNDEVLRARSGQVETPLFGSILHLGPQRGLVGGETMFDLGYGTRNEADHPRFVERSLEEVLAHAVAPVVIPQRAGRLILFRGDIPHAVAPVRACEDDQPRVALLANLWQARITAVPAVVTATSIATSDPP